MDLLRTVLFEDPVWLYVACGVVEAVLALAWYYRRSRKLAWALLAPLALAVAVGVTAQAVTTDREKLSEAIDRLAFAVEHGDHATVVELVDREYADQRWDRNEVLAAAARVMTRYKFQQIAVSDLDAQLADGQAVTKLTARITADVGFGASQVPTAWTVWWVLRPDGWRIVSARLDSPPGIDDAPTGRP